MGTSFANQLPTSQRKEFLQEEKITVHKGGKEGSSIFSSYHHPNRLKEIFEKQVLL